MPERLPLADDGADGPSPRTGAGGDASSEIPAPDERVPKEASPAASHPPGAGFGGVRSLVSTPPLSAFTIVKNASLHEYPLEAALRSVLPLCDELVINVGASEDDTRRRVDDFVAGAGAWIERHAEVLFREGVAITGGRQGGRPEPPEIRVLERDWGPERGRTTAVHSEETNRALERCEHDWALYVQADEVLHERDYGALGAALAEAHRRVGRGEPVEGLVFDYLHFYGSPDWVLRGRRAYRREVRLVRRGSGIRSVGGARGFRVDDRKPRTIRGGARVFHYGYARSREALTEKLRLGARYAGRDDAEVGPYRFRRHPGLERFRGTHPLPAREWMAGRDWDFDPSEAAPPPLDLDEIRVRLSDAVERWTGHRLFEHRNYRPIE